MTRKIKLAFFSFMAALDISVILAAAPEGDTAAVACASFGLVCFIGLLLVTMIHAE